MFPLWHAATLCFLLAAGCTTSTRNGPADQCRQDYVTLCQGIVQVPSGSIPATPIQYPGVNGVRLAIREFGSSEPLLMLNGFGATMDHFYIESLLSILYL